ncbi:MAG: Gfo/Idh/MocA family oxidoreductase [Planctomycetota bacterium]
MLRFGVLGAARIAPAALLEPAQNLPGVEVVAIASRDPQRARPLADRYGVPRVCTYGELYADPEVDAIYVALPASAHADAALHALDAGKHVLVEKPFASNAGQAKRVVAAAQAAGRVCAEAFHWRYHPLAARIQEAVRELGALEEVDAGFTVEIPTEDEVRHAYALSGGALMDLGCYALQWVRFVHPAGEPRVVRARMREGAPRVDVETEVELAYPDGTAAKVLTSMSAGTERRAWLRVVGERGTLEVDNPLAPHTGHELRLELDGALRRETVDDDETTYQHQLRAFLDAVESGTPLPTGGDDAIATLELIDAAYKAAGLPLRGV